MPPHIQQMLFDFALERGYIDLIIEEKEKRNEQSNTNQFDTTVQENK